MQVFIALLTPRRDFFSKVCFSRVCTVWRRVSRCYLKWQRLRPHNSCNNCPNRNNRYCRRQSMHRTHISRLCLSTRPTSRHNTQLFITRPNKQWEHTIKRHNRTHIRVYRKTKSVQIRSFIATVIIVIIIVVITTV